MYTLKIWGPAKIIVLWIDTSLFYRLSFRNNIIFFKVSHTLHGDIVSNPSNTAFRQHARDSNILQVAVAIES